MDDNNIGIFYALKFILEKKICILNISTNYSDSSGH